MEYLPSESANRILESISVHIHGEGWVKDINKVVTAFHSQGYVHGDLRPPNFVVNHNKLYVIDFDWGGKEGEVEFPDENLNPVVRRGRWERLITKENDMRAMEFTKECVRDAIKLGPGSFGIPKIK
jgi:serine/threonine protein kinase